MALTLEQEVREALDETGVKSEVRDSIYHFLTPLKEKCAATAVHYEHSQRVGLIGRQIARHMHLDEKVLLIGGLLHDIGKAQTCIETLSKTSGWTPQDTEEMKAHVMDGYRLLRGKMDFTAEVIVWHHKFQRGGYPEQMPAPLHPYCTGTQAMIPFYGRLLALADCYDALHRVNDKFGEVKALGPDEIKAKMLEFHPDQARLINELYSAEIFGAGTPPAPAVERIEHDEIYQRCFNDGAYRRTPEEIRRFVQLSCALEPITDKIGCTSRLTDSSPFQRLEYFVAAAINIGTPFERLARCMNSEEGSTADRREHPLPTYIYPFALQAQLYSKRNRKGGRINQGIIEILTPIVAAQCYFDPRGEKDAEETLSNASRILDLTSPNDVEFLRQMKRTAYDLSGYFDREVPQHAATTVGDYYRLDLEQSKTSTSIAHNSEFVDGFPTVRAITTWLQEDTNTHLVHRIESAYRQARMRCSPGVAAGFLADCTAAGIYLLLSDRPTEKIIG